MKLTIGLEGNEMMTIDEFPEVQTITRESKSKDFMTGKLSFETECGKEYKQIPAKIYSSGKVIGETEDGYIIECNFDPNKIQWV